MAFRAIKTPTSLRADVPVAFKATKNLEDTMLSFGYRSWQGSFLELPKSCQPWELTFLSTVAFLAAKIPTTRRSLVLNFRYSNFCCELHRACWKHLDLNPSEPLLPNWGVLYRAFFSDRETLELSTDPCNISGISKLYCNAHFTYPVIIRFLSNVFSFFYCM